jgi:SAM-dependent methyltransferase
MPEWWEVSFSGLWQDAQLGLPSEEQNRAAVDKITHVLELRPNSHVLDVPCGGGRIAIELAARGHEVTGVDLTERFVDHAQQVAKQRGVSVRWQLRDMRDLPFESEFDAAVNYGGSFGYFSDDENRRFASAVWRALKPSGALLIDMPAPETIFPHFRERFWAEAGDFVVLAESRYDHETGRIEGDWTILAPDGRREKRHSSMRLYTYRELLDLLRTVGFAEVKGFDAENLEPFALGASRLVLVAAKE